MSNNSVPLVEAYLELPIWARISLGSMAMKRLSTFPKAPALLEAYNQIIYCHIQDTRLGLQSYYSAEIEPAYSTLHLSKLGC